MNEHANDCVCQSCHESRHGLWSVVIPPENNRPTTITGYATMRPRFSH